MAVDFFSGESLYRDVVTYSQLGEHRTSSQGEEITTDWIIEQLSKTGLKTATQNFTLRQFFVRQSILVVAGKPVDCFPWWYPCSTGQRPLIAPLSQYNNTSRSLKGKIALVASPFVRGGPRYDRPAAEAFIRPIVRAGALSVIVITRGPSGELVAFNTPETVEPWPVPVVLVGSKDESTLASATARNAEASLLVDGRDEPQARARNAFAYYNRSQDFIVISTPKSGWFYCGGERGPGVALALALARWVSQRQPPVSYWFDFNSGHELDNLGTREFLNDVAPPPDQVRCWLHLGANIATWSFEDSPSGLKRIADPEKYGIICSTDDLLPLVNTAFAGIKGIKPVVGPGLGELIHVVENGYRCFGVFGGRYHFFHTPSDNPIGTAPELLEPVARALTTALESIEARTRP
jgi:hypothetical protein